MGGRWEGLRRTHAVGACLLERQRWGPSAPQQRPRAAPEATACRATAPCSGAWARCGSSPTSGLRCSPPAGSSPAGCVGGRAGRVGLVWGRRACAAPAPRLGAGPSSPRACTMGQNTPATSSSPLLKFMPVVFAKGQGGLSGRPAQRCCEGRQRHPHAPPRVFTPITSKDCGRKNTHVGYHTPKKAAGSVAVTAPRDMMLRGRGRGQGGAGPVGERCCRTQWGHACAHATAPHQPGSAGGGATGRPKHTDN